MDCHIFANNSHITQTSSKLDQSLPTHHQHILKVDPTHHQKRSVPAIRFCRFGQNVPDIGEKASKTIFFITFHENRYLPMDLQLFWRFALARRPAGGQPAHAWALRRGTSEEPSRSSEEFRGTTLDPPALTHPRPLSLTSASQIQHFDFSIFFMIFEIGDISSQFLAALPEIMIFWRRHS